MSICFFCEQSENQTFKELPNEFFCGCNYHKGLQKANDIRITKIEESLKDNDKFLKLILNDLSNNETDINDIKNKIKNRLNIKSCSILNL